MSNTETIIQMEMPATSAADSFLSAWSGAIPMILVFMVFYFLLIRPQEKKRKEHEKLVNSIKKGENIVTHSGIFGRVISIDEKEGNIELEIAAGTNIKIMKSAIANVVDSKLESKEIKKSDNKKKNNK